MKRPDKLPTMPEGVNPYAWIVRAADAVRRRQFHLAEIERARLAAERKKEMAALLQKEAAEDAPKKRGPKPRVTS